MNPRLRPLLLLTALVAAVTSHASEPITPAAGRLHVAGWTYGAWGRTYTGTACWLDEDDGRWRLEIAIGEPRGLARLLAQHGEGWSVITVDPGRTYVQPWRDKIETLVPAEAARVQALVRLAEAGPDPTALSGLGVDFRSAEAKRPPRLPWGESAVPKADTVILSWPTPETGDLRAALRTRGRGRGGAGEIWHVSALPEGGIRITSSRRAGALRVHPMPSRPANYDPDEVYVPLWPLGEVVGEE